MVRTAKAPRRGERGKCALTGRSGRRAFPPAPGRWWNLLPVAVVLLSAPGVVWGQESAAYFRQNCTSCHTISGGRLVGPDLKGITERKDTEWLIDFILNPQAMIDRGDPHALQILQEFNGVVMPPVPGMTRARAQALLELIAAESQLETSQFHGVQVSDRPFTPQDVEQGRALFLGKQSLVRGGPACMACHTVEGLGGLSGGRLGPDLTKVYERIGGRKPLSAWLVGPATTTMRPVFANHPLQPDEILPLVAFFEQKAREPEDDNSVAPLSFFLIGLGGTVVGLVVLDGIWRRRLQGVRSALVHGPASGGTP